jgi:hypothetical protein
VKIIIVASILASCYGWRLITEDDNALLRIIGILAAFVVLILSTWKFLNPIESIFVFGAYIALSTIICIRLAGILDSVISQSIYIGSCILLFLVLCLSRVKNHQRLKQQWLGFLTSNLHPGLASSPSLHLYINGQEVQDWRLVKKTYGMIQILSSKHPDIQTIHPSQVRILDELYLTWIQFAKTA